MRHGSLGKTGARLARRLLPLLLLLLAGAARAQGGGFYEWSATEDSISMSWWADYQYSGVHVEYEDTNNEWRELWGPDYATAEGLQPGTSYNFVLIGYNEEWGYSETIAQESYSTQGSPPPSGSISLYITAMARYKMKVDWLLNDAGPFDHFEIWHRTNNQNQPQGDWILRGTSPGDTTMFMVNDLEPSNRYDFKVIGVFEGGGTMESDTLTGVVEPPPPAVQVELDQANPQHDVRISWQQPNKAYFQYYEVYRSLNGAQYTLLDQITDPDQDEYLDQNLPEGSVLKYFMWIRNDVGNSWPQVFNIRTGAPTDIRLVLNRDNHVDVKWRDTSVNGTYTVERSLDGSYFTPLGSTQTASGSGNTLSHHDSTISNDTLYYYRVRKTGSSTLLTEPANIRTFLPSARRTKLGTLASFMANYWSASRWPKMAAALGEFAFDLVEIELMIYPAVTDGQDWIHFPAPIDDANSIEDRLELIDNRFRSLSWPVEYIYSLTRAHFGSALRILNDRTNPTKWQTLLDLEDKTGVSAGEAGVHRLDPITDWFSKVVTNESTGGKRLLGFDYVEQDIDHSAKNPDAKLFDSAFAFIGGGRLSVTREDGSVQYIPALKDTDSLNNSSSAAAIMSKYNEVVGKLAEISAKYLDRRLNSRANFPDLFHMYAAAGWDINFKLLKENLSTVVTATALGAGLEYAGDNVEMGTNIDLFGTRTFRTADNFQYIWDDHTDPPTTVKESYPGHSPDALYSALLMSYGLGLDRAIVESFDHTKTNPDATAKETNGQREETLIGWNVFDSDMYNADNEEQKTIEYHKTAWGDKYLEFRDKYGNTHPGLNWRDYRPKVAIIRIPDGNWGLRGSMFDCAEGYDGNKTHPWLFGSQNFWAHRYHILASENTSGEVEYSTSEVPNGIDYKSEEWLHAWSLLTGHYVNGFVKPGAINLVNYTLYYKKNHLPDGTTDYQSPFLQPMDSAAVFDHLVTEAKVGTAVWEGINCFVVTGHALSDETAQAIDDRLQDVGLAPAKCVIDRDLFESKTSIWSDPTNTAKFVVLDPYNDSAAAAAFGCKETVHGGFPMYTEALKNALAPFVPKDQFRAIYRYVDKAVVFTRLSDGARESDKIVLRVYPIGLIGQMYNRLDPNATPPYSPFGQFDLDMDGSVDIGTDDELFDLNSDTVFDYQDLVTLCNWLGEEVPPDPGA